MSRDASSSAGADSPAPLSRIFLSGPVVAVALVLVAGMSLEWLPVSERLHLWTRHESAAMEAYQPLADEQKEGAAELATETRTRTELSLPEKVTLPTQAGPIAQARDADYVVPSVDAEAPPRPIEDPSGSLDKFYAALARTARGRARGAADQAPDEPSQLAQDLVTRIVYHGDSVVASDYVTGTLRRKLQEHFGDAGHGFVLVADAWPSYFHNDVFRFASRGWQLSRIVGPYARDGLYGLGGVSFKAPPGVRARIGTAETGKFGRRVSKFRVLYLEQPFGGDIQVNLDGKPYGLIATEGPEPTSGVYDVVAPDGEHLLELVTKRRFTRLFGVVMEREGPGVVLDAIGIQGARLRFLDKQDDAHWAQQLALRKPNLIVYQFGANESGDGFAYSMPDYHATMKAVLEQGLAAAPDAGCLVLAAMDRARKEGDWVVTLPIIPHIVREQEATAREVGCAFFNTFEAMGGKGSMAKWVRRGLGQADMTHPSGYGAQVMGNWLFQALIQGYNESLGHPGTRRSEP